MVIDMKRMEIVMETEFPRLLVISHNLLDVSNNVGKTLISLLKGWPKDCLYSLYFRNEKPSNYYCDSYYLIHDKDVIKGLLSLGFYKPGIAFSTNEDVNGNNSNSQAENALYKLGNKRKSVISLLRDIIWKLGSWKNNQLKDWLRSVNPDIILFVPNDYELAYDVLFYVNKFTNAKLITYYMDDAFYCNQKIFGVNKYRRKRLMECGIECSKISEKLFTTCDMMSIEYEHLFKIKCIPFGNSVKIVEKNFEKKNNNKRIAISYIGNLHSNRWKSILEIGNALENINHENHTDYLIDVYSASLLDVAVLNDFNKSPAINFWGAVNVEQVRKIQEESDILVHVEAFDEKSVSSTRLSVSTKIFEYLAVQKPILAYGPSEIASMRYLQCTGAAVCCFSKDALINSLSSLLFSDVKRQELSKNAKEFVRVNCDPEKQNCRFREEIMTVMGNK